MTKFKISVLLILIISAFLRYHNLPQSFVFAGDEEHQTILAQSLVKDFHIIWIGVNAAHLGFYLGPYWVYFTAFWIMLSKGDPLITGYVSSSFGVFTTFLIILAGSIIFNKIVGLISGLLYATLPLMVFFDQRYWNPTPIPLLSILMFLSLARLKQDPRMAILFSVCFGLVFHTHLSLIPIILIAIIWIVKMKIYLSKGTIFLSVVSFLIVIAPLLVFDFFHKGTNITTPLRFREISADSVNKINPAHHFQALFQTLGRIYYLKPQSVNADEVIAPCAYSSRADTKAELSTLSKRFNPPPFLSFAGTAFFFLFLINKSTWRIAPNRLLAQILLSIMISFLLFPGAAFEYYLLGIFPLILFIPGILINYFEKFRYLIIFLALTLSILGIYTIITNNSLFGIEAKKSLISKVSKFIGNEPFDIKQTGICHNFEGWRYLFVLNGKKPERSDSDNGLGWLYQQEITEKKTKYSVILSESRVPVSFDKKEEIAIKESGFNAYIFKNY